MPAFIFSRGPVGVPLHSARDVFRGAALLLTQILPRLYDEVVDSTGKTRHDRAYAAPTS